MSSIGDKLASIWESLSNIPGKIAEGISNAFSGLWTWLKDIFDGIVSLPGKIGDLIIDGIKAIFVPDGEQLKEDFNYMISDIGNSFGITADGFTDLKDSWTERPAEDINANYNIHGIGTLNLKFLDTQYLKDGVDRFRPVIRGLVVILMFFYNYYQILSFIGQDPRVSHEAQRTAEIHIARKEKNNK